MSVEVYYYGCLGEVGHYWYGHTTRHRAPADVPSEIARRIDTWLCPGIAPRPTPQVEGTAALHHVEGWTALAWWDRSVDTRPGSNSVLVARGTLGVDDMLALGLAHFPEVMARQKTVPVLVET